MSVGCSRRVALHDRDPRLPSEGNLAGPCFVGFAIVSPRRLRPPHLPRHLHQDRRHRCRPHEDRLQPSGRPAQSRRDRRCTGEDAWATPSGRPPMASRRTASPVSL
jgi:hypothetical protein